MSDMFVPFGILFDGISALPMLADALLDHPLVYSSDFGVGAPLFKATPELAQMHRQVSDARMRFRRYLEEGVLREDVRQAVAQRFAETFIRRHGSGERRDIFLASAEVIRLSVELKPLPMLDGSQRDEVVSRIQRYPHDNTVLQQQLQATDPADDQARQLGLQARSLSFKVFIDHIYNPIRLKEPVIAKHVQERAFKQPCVFEIWANPSIPGYAARVVEDLAQTISGVAVWMEQQEVPR